MQGMVARLHCLGVRRGDVSTSLFLNPVAGLRRAQMAAAGVVGTGTYNTGMRPQLALPTTICPVVIGGVASPRPRVQERALKPLSWEFMIHPYHLEHDQDAAV